MAAPSSSDDGEVVDLGMAGDLDDATRIFFSDGDSVGAHLSWPAAAGITSALTTQSLLRDMCDKHGVPKEFRPACAAHSGWAACQTPPLALGSNTICVYAAALDAGLHFPLHDFYAKVPRHYRPAPSQLTPNAWRCLAAFVLLCKDAGIDPLVSAFRYFFTICAHKHDPRPAGWHHFQPYTDGGRRLFTGTPPTKAGWKLKFFFLEAPAAMDWKCPVKWGKPRRDAARKVELTDTAIQKLKRIGSVDVMSFLAGREMPVGDQIRLQAAVKAEATPADVSAACTWNKRKSPEGALSCPPQPLPTSAPPQQQSSAMPTSAAPPGRGFSHRGAHHTGLEAAAAAAGNARRRTT
ncbi:hypothetical protein C2845_PM03G27310 [Panicum miliaceum]|uniref:Transposase (putative) gypsy type domain-containing protein n=1 Tax=Panicum miliaceum TaxID=4540 RepID=A0A3L6TBP8_PANMI|nr:hypothetical protein C2845_PM03G27310 [Panicum miliaceum]